MTASTLDPAIAIAAAGYELLEGLRGLVERGEPDDVPGLLDELARLLRRARGRVNRATRQSETGPPAPARAAESAKATPTPQQPPRRDAGPASVASAQRQPRVTVPPPAATRRQEPVEPKLPPEHVAMPSRRPTWQLTTAVCALVLLAVTLLALMGCSTSRIAPTPAPVSSFSSTSLPDRGLECALFEPAPVDMPNFHYVGQQCINLDGTITRWINAFYRCVDGRIWPVLTTMQPPASPPEPTGLEFDKCIGR